jgi:hypothetical protein
MVGAVEPEDDDPALHLLRRGGRSRGGEDGEEGGREDETGSGSGGHPKVRHAAF